MVNDVIHEIKKLHEYKITAEYWGRVGMLCKRYGEDVVLKAVADCKPSEVPLTVMLNKVEKRCQVILESGEVDELTSLFLDM